MLAVMLIDIRWDNISKHACSCYANEIINIISLFSACKSFSGVLYRTILPDNIFPCSQEIFDYVCHNICPCNI